MTRLLSSFTRFFANYFLSPLKDVRENIKKEQRETLYVQHEKLAALAAQLQHATAQEKARISSANILLKVCRFCFCDSQKELTKTETLAHKLGKIIKRGQEGVVVTSQTASAMRRLERALATEPPLTGVAKGQAVPLPTLSAHQFFRTHKSIYLVDSELGRGGGKVAQKVFDATRGKYAVHLQPKDGHTPKKIKHANCEAQAFMALKGIQNVIQCKEILHTEDAPSFITAYANRGILSSQASKLTETEKESIAIDILKGLAAIHERGIIHRDIKPANILLVQKTAEDLTTRLIAKVADFDLCVPPKLTLLALEVRKNLCGTKGFIAPELLAAARAHTLPMLKKMAISQATSPAVDIYSAGITLYYLFGGSIKIKDRKKRDYEQEAICIRQQLESPATPIRFASLILSMLANDPCQRPSALEALMSVERNIPASS